MDAKISVEAGNPEISIIPDRDKMASLGVSPGGLGLALYDAFNGNTDTKFRDGNKLSTTSTSASTASTGEISPMWKISLS
jgi:multidrug efflux pump subunit AcrB